MRADALHEKPEVLLQMQRAELEANIVSFNTATGCRLERSHWHADQSVAKNIVPLRP